MTSTAKRFSDERARKALLADCQRLISERAAANSVAIATAIVDRLGALSEATWDRFLADLANEFAADPAAILGAAREYAKDRSAERLVDLSRAVEPPRQELLRRINRAPGGTAAVLRIRAELLQRLHAAPDLKLVDHDLLHLLSSWFSPGFLRMRRVDWTAPAQLLEQLIVHEAVHTIDGWDDLRRRLQPDRRCFAFFHPQLADVPLIFVEVALVEALPDRIAPLLDKHSTPLDPSRARVAAFYSISNCERGLRNVSLGNFLLKRVVEELNRELSQVKTFCTLSPIPGFARWLRGFGPASLTHAQEVAELAAAERSILELAVEGRWDMLVHEPERLQLSSRAQRSLARLCAIFLVHCSATENGDPVARFHLDNGARLEQLRPNANASKSGLEQSYGYMVNYLYDLRKIESNHESFTRGEVKHSRAIAALL
ncbi:MAG TPA: malonyl-CoA decarboxylase family protein [Casimicrobiaceae bacterium]|nr:malonyl-CoA decarboxylase family protein [Casimicrobiaceae bacterium]